MSQDKLLAGDIIPPSAQHGACSVDGMVLPALPRPKSWKSADRQRSATAKEKMSVSHNCEDERRQVLSRLTSDLKKIPRRKVAKQYSKETQLPKELQEKIEAKTPPRKIIFKTIRWASIP